ncbi:hypothetical protein ACTQ45_03045 [Fundicoccus sp. Sow4_D5]|uniref:hypothetical protein n=1 Tax=Fundicoccus sp. Sow4_D5 TaxID=3438782 RepID=UPI003F907C26
MDRFENPEIGKWSYFGWRNSVYGDDIVSKRNPKSVGLSQIVHFDEMSFGLRMQYLNMSNPHCCFHHY